MYSLALGLILFTASVVALAVALRRLAGWRANARPALVACVAAVVSGYVVAVPLWWHAQSELADDDAIGGYTVVFVTVWVFALPALFLLGDRRPGATLVRWLAFGLVVLVVGLLEAFVVDQFVLVTARPMWVTTMSPTLRQDHSVQPCPECGGEFVVTLFPIRGSDGVVRHNDRFRREGVCSQCLYSVDGAEHIGEFRGKDHFTVNRLMAPERWRVVAFARGNPSFPNTGRVVGLPGEMVFIRDGVVWVDGVRQTPPAGIVPVRYSEELPKRFLNANPLLKRAARAHGYAHPDEPLVLKPDEYFLLNDDPGDPLDGRESGPVHWANYLSVVEVIYWPPRRWGLVR